MRMQGNARPGTEATGFLYPFCLGLFSRPHQMHQPLKFHQQPGATLAWVSCVQVTLYNIYIGLLPTLSTHFPLVFQCFPGFLASEWTERRGVYGDRIPPECFLFKRHHRLYIREPTMCAIPAVPECVEFKT